MKSVVSEIHTILYSEVPGTEKPFHNWKHYFLCEAYFFLVEYDTVYHLNQAATHSASYLLPGRV